MNNICEHFKKDYSRAVRIALHDVMNNEVATHVYWEWVCEKCGQIYREKVKEAIDISENQ